MNVPVESQLTSGKPCSPQPVYVETLLRRSPLSVRVDSTVNFSGLPTAPLMKLRTVWALCRYRHKAHYADVQIMPTCVGNPACTAGIAAIVSA
jgi:hypothetical protein